MEDLPEARTSGEDLSLTGILLCVLLAGALSMLCAEVLSGASVLWFVTAWGWLVTLPLYMVHLVFLFTLAVMFRRTSLTSLYLWGVIFGLYESWITKVTWAGYIGSEPAWGTVLGFAPAEFLIIVFFWHPVMSFLLPLLLFETLSSPGAETPLLPGHQWLLAQGRRSVALFTGFALIGAAFLTMNSEYNAISALVTLLVSAGIVAVFYKAVLKVTRGNFSVYALSLKKPGLILALAYLAALYVLAFFFLVPERIPQVPTILLTILVYAVVVLLIWLDRPASGDGMSPVRTEKILGVRQMAGFLLLVSGLIVLFSLVPPLGGAVGTGIYLLLIILGPVVAITVAGLILFRFIVNKKMRGGMQE